MRMSRDTFSLGWGQFRTLQGCPLTAGLHNLDPVQQERKIEREEWKWGGGISREKGRNRLQAV